jgi:PAS domain S-box-containing protein
VHCRPDGYFQRLNPAAESILGYTREELLAKQFLDFIHPDDRDRTREMVSTLASQQKVFSFENRYRCKDGTYRWLQWSSALFGKLIYAAARDMTEQKQSEESLREAEEKYRNIFEGAVEGSWHLAVIVLIAMRWGSTNSSVGLRPCRAKSPKWWRRISPKISGRRW